VAALAAGKRKKRKARYVDVKQKFAKKVAPLRKEADPDHPSNATVAAVPRFLLPDSDIGSSDDVLRRHSSFNMRGDMLIDIDSMSRDGSVQASRVSSPRARLLKQPRVTKAAVVVEAVPDEQIRSFEHWITGIDDDGTAVAAAALGIAGGNASSVGSSDDMNLDHLAKVLFSDSEKGGTSATEAADAADFNGVFSASSSDKAAAAGGSGSDSTGDIFKDWNDPFLDEDENSVGSFQSSKSSDSDSFLEAMGDGFGAVANEGSSLLSSDDTATGVVETDDWMAHIRHALVDMDLSLSSSSSDPSDGTDADNMSDLFSFSSSDSQSH
jgi:hypothetical protein